MVSVFAETWAGAQPNRPTGTAMVYSDDEVEKVGSENETCLEYSTGAMCCQTYWKRRTTWNQVWIFPSISLHFNARKVLVPRDI